MKALISFFNHTYKNQIINIFTDQNPIVDNKALTIPKYVKIDYSTSNLNCYCYDLKTADKILSEVCIVDSNIHFPNELENVMFNAEVIDFNNLMQYAHTGTLQHLNTELQEISFEKQICEWLYAVINVQNNNAIINLKFTSITAVNDIQKQRIKQHPLIYAYILKQYFDFKGELDVPIYSKTYYYKYIYSELGFKRYNKFLNKYNDYTYDGTSYTYELNNGYIKFSLTDLSIPYPNTIEFKSESEDDLKAIAILNEVFKINNVQEITETYNLNYSVEDLIKQGYIKNESFFEYIKTEDDVKYIYDIYADKLEKTRKFIL